MIKGAPSRDQRSTVTELADRLQLAQSTVTELVGRAEEVGLHPARGLARTTAASRTCGCTDEGERRLDGAFAELEGDRQRLLEAFLALAQRL